MENSKKKSYMYVVILLVRSMEIDTEMPWKMFLWEFFRQLRIELY